MLKFGSRKNYLSVIILIAVILFFLSGFVTTEASLRPLNLNELMEKSLLRFRKVEVNGIVFDVYTNQKEKSITVLGGVESWEEKEIAEKYFRLRAPSDFYLNYEISVLY
ncbi:MAG: hypothetical protein ACMUIU_18540 [bacterium]